MLKTLPNIVIFLCITLFTIAVILYLRTHADYRNGLIHKAGNLLLYGYLKLYLTIHRGTSAFHTHMKSIFAHYPFGNENTADLHQKKQHLLSLKHQLGRTPQDYTKASRYNLKILK